MSDPRSETYEYLFQEEKTAKIKYVENKYNVKKEIALEAKEDAHRLRIELDREIRERREEVKRSEKRLIQKEESIDKKIENIEKKEDNLSLKEEKILEKENEVDRFLEKQMEELERISGYSVEEAKALLLSNCEKEIRYEASLLIKDIISKAKEEGDKKAKEKIGRASCRERV